MRLALASFLPSLAQSPYSVGRLALEKDNGRSGNKEVGEAHTIFVYPQKLNSN